MKTDINGILASVIKNSLSPIISTVREQVKESNTRMKAIEDRVSAIEKGMRGMAIVTAPIRKLGSRKAAAAPLQESRFVTKTRKPRKQKQTGITSEEISKALAATSTSMSGAGTAE